MTDIQTDRQDLPIKSHRRRLKTDNIHTDSECVESNDKIMRQGLNELNGQGSSV